MLAVVDCRQQSASKAFKSNLLNVNIINTIDVLAVGIH